MLVEDKNQYEPIKRDTERSKLSLSYSCRLLFPLARPPPRLCFLCAFFLCLLESELFFFAAFLSTCLLPLDLPANANTSRKSIYKYILKKTSLDQKFPKKKILSKIGEYFTATKSDGNLIQQQIDSILKSPYHSL